MKRVIFSLYIDIPDERLDEQPAYRGDNVSKSMRTKLELYNHYEKLLETKLRYAEVCDCNFLMYEYDDDWLFYYSNMKKQYPFFTDYHIINFYKLQIMYELSRHYDEVLYLDFDVVAATDENFFEAWDLSKGIAIANNNDHVRQRFEDIGTCNRSPSAKYFNSMAMLIDEDLGYKNNVFNTGIVGASAKHLEQLGYFDNFEDNIAHMHSLMIEAPMFPDNVRNVFGYDNETLWSYKVAMTDTPIQWLDDKWHFFMDNEYIIKDVKLIHAINKKFDKIWKYCEENNIQCL